MLLPSVPFYGIDGNQIDWLWVEQGYGVEANVFNGNDLTVEGFSRLERNIRAIQAKGNDKVSLHFPTDDANYLEDAGALDKFVRFIDLALDYQIEVIVVHSNHFVSSTDYSQQSIDNVRLRFLDIFDTLNQRLKGSKLHINVENMPWIGNESFDMDPIYIFPEHFAGLEKISNIGVTFDLCHWGQTHLLNNTMAKLLGSDSKVSFSHFASNCGIINHLHLSSFSGLSFPASNAVCTEGVLPQKGDIKQSMLIEQLNYFHQLDKDMLVVFEVTDINYTKRQNSWHCLKWLQENVIQ